jgi:hypothetical protein
MKVNYHGVMHFSTTVGNAINLRLSEMDAAFSIYIRNAITLACTLRRHGNDLTLHTNDIDMCTRLVASFSVFPIQIELLKSHYNPPSNIAFYSAHQKLNLYRTLASRTDGAHCVVDLDMVMLQPLPQWLVEVWRNGRGVVYDITAQVVPSVGHERIQSDLEKIIGRRCEGRWFGGEFIAGTADFWRILCSRIEQVWPQYEIQYKELSHQGDEVLSSAALQTLAWDEVIAVDVGGCDLIKRHWSVYTDHEQVGVTEARRNLCLLHLPADKQFLASCAAKDFADGNKWFWRRYRIEYTRRKALSFGKHWVKNVLGGSR